MRNTDVIIIGTGACGLMAAWELAKAGKRELSLFTETGNIPYVYLKNVVSVS